MSSTPSYISLYDLLETDTLPSGEALAQAISRMRRKRLTDLEFSPSGYITVAGREFGRNDIDLYYQAPQDADALAKYHNLVRQDRNLAAMIEHGKAPMFPPAQDSKFSDPGFVDFVKPYFLEQLQALLNRAAENERVMEFFVLTKTVGSFGGMMRQEILEAVEESLRLRLFQIEAKLESEKTNPSWNWNLPWLSKGSAQIFAALPPELYDWRVRFGDFLVNCFHHCQTNSVYHVYVERIVECYNLLELRPEHYRFRKTQVQQPEQKNAPSYLRAGWIVIVLIIAIIRMSGTKSCNSSRSHDYDQTSYSLPDAPTVPEIVLHSDSNPSVTELNSWLRLQHMAAPVDSSSSAQPNSGVQVYGDLTYMDKVNNENDVFDYTNQSPNDVVVILVEDNAISDCRYIRKGDSFKFICNKAASPVYYEYKGTTWLPAISIGEHGDMKYFTYGRFATAANPVNPIEGPFFVK